MPNLANSSTIVWTETSGNLTAAALLDVADLADVDMTGLTATDLVTYDGASWVPLARSTFALASHTHVLADVLDAGTAAAYDVPATGDAALAEVVIGSDTRLTDARTPTAHTHVEADITDLGSYLPTTGGQLTGNLGINTAAHASHPLVLRGNGGTVDVGITQNYYSGAAAMEFITSDAVGVLTPRLAITASSNTPSMHFLIGSYLSQTPWATYSGSANTFDVIAPLLQNGNQVWHAGNLVSPLTSSSVISDLSDVAATAPSTNDVLTWNGSTWTPAAGGGAFLPLAGGTLTGLLTLDDVTTGQALIGGQSDSVYLDGYLNVRAPSGITSTSAWNVYNVSSTARFTVPVGSAGGNVTIDGNKVWHTGTLLVDHTDGTVNITAGSTWTPSKGMWQIATTGSGRFRVQVLQGGTWRDGTITSVGFASVITEGSQARVFNAGTGTITVYYLKNGA